MCAGTRGDSSEEDRMLMHHAPQSVRCAVRVAFALAGALLLFSIEVVTKTGQSWA